MPDADVAAAGGWTDTRALKLSYQHADPATVLEAETADVVRVHFEGLLGQEVLDAGGSTGLGPRVVRLEAAPGRQPDRVLLAHHLRGRAVVDHLEDAPAVSHTATAR